jgi:hypothetical protein
MITEQTMLYSLFAFVVPFMGLLRLIYFYIFLTKFSRERKVTKETHCP